MVQLTFISTVATVDMLSRTSIQEANKHLHAMHERIASLENTIQHQNQTLIDRDLMYQEQFQQLHASKGAENQTLHSKIKDVERDSMEKDKLLEVQKQLAEAKDIKINDLEEKVDILNQILTFLPTLKSMVGVLDRVNLSNSLLNGEVEDMPGNFRTNHATSRTPKASSLAKHYVTNPRSRNFSISEDSEEDNPSNSGDDTITNIEIDTLIHNESPVMDSHGTLQGKEYYL